MRYKNNPFNIRYSDKNHWLGLVGSDNGFCEFKDNFCCVRAFLIILHNYSKRNIFTVKDIIYTYAPPSENNSFSYVRYVCNEIVVPLNWPINVFCPVDTYRFAKAVCKFESGHDLLRSEFDGGYRLFLKSNNLLFDYV